MYICMLVSVQVKVQRFSIKEINPMGRLRGKVHAIHASHPAIVCNKVVALSLVGLQAARLSTRIMIDGSVRAKICRSKENYLQE